MCAIFGSSNHTLFSVMYQKGCERGDFAHGFVYIDGKGNPIIHKGPGKASTINYNARYFLGHTQAPTSSVREFDSKTSHPFRVGNWIVAHNGVLENDRELVKKYWLYDIVNDVDSSVIPALFYFFTSNIGKQIDKSASVTKCLLDALSELKGTFAIWAYNTETGRLYLARSGSLLYSHANNFSSNQILPEYELLAEGKLYSLRENGYNSYFDSLGTFKTNSQFFL